MFLTVVGLFLLLIISYFVFEKAKKNGHSAILWTILAVVTFLGAYIFLLFVTAIIFIRSGWTIDAVRKMGDLPHLAILLISLVSMMLVFLPINKRKEKTLNRPNLEE